jgi:site-specific recombinase XerD
MKKSSKLLPVALFASLKYLQDPFSENGLVYLSKVHHKAKDNAELVKQFLKLYVHSEDTFNSYRRDIERYCHWCWLIRGISVEESKRDDLIAYLDFVKSPDKNWISIKASPRFTLQEGLMQPNPDWRPFVLRLSKIDQKQNKTPRLQDYQCNPPMLRAVFSVLGSFFHFLLEETRITANPVAQIRQKKQYLGQTQKKRITRKLSKEQWFWMIRCIEEKTQQDPRFERHLFILSLFYLLGLRISEVAETPGRIPNMGHFFRDHQSCVWFETTGKGNKTREIAVPDSLVDGLARFRKHLGLGTSFPLRNESTPLIPKQKGKGGLGIRQVRICVQTCFDLAIESLKKQSLHEQAQDLMTATVHWLRHTAITHDVQSRPREHVRDDAGHESSQTTDLYIEDDRRARHASAKDKKLIDS